MSLQPPITASVGDVWIDPITADRFIFTGENLDGDLYGWKPWDLASEEAAYRRDKEAAGRRESCLQGRLAMDSYDYGPESKEPWGTDTERLESSADDEIPPGLEGPLDPDYDLNRAELGPSSRPPGCPEC